MRVGDVVRVKEDEYFPADLLLIASSGTDGICYVETKNLDVAYNSNNFSNNPSNMEGPYLSHNQQMHISYQNDAPKTNYPNFEDVTKQ